MKNKKNNNKSQSRRDFVQKTPMAFVFIDAAPTEIYTLSYTLSLHDALPIFSRCSSGLPDSSSRRRAFANNRCMKRSEEHTSELQSHSEISYAVFCLKKK